MDLNLNVTAVDSRAAAPRSATASTTSAASSASSTAQAADQGSSDAVPVQTLKDAVGTLQDLMQVTHRNLEFSIDEGSGEQVVKVVAQDTGEVIRQMPSEVALKLAQSLKDGNTSLFDGWA